MVFVGIAAPIGELISDLFFIDGIIRFGLHARLLADERVLRRPGSGADVDFEYPRCDSEGVIDIGCNDLHRDPGHAQRRGGQSRRAHNCSPEQRDDQ